MNPVIETVSLSKTYGKKENTVHALRDCSLQFEAGSFTAVVGRSGSGKSTLLHLLGGLDEPTNGQVLVEGKNLYGISDKQRTLLRRRRIGFVFQFFNLLPELTAWQNIMLPLDLDHQKQDKAYIDEVIGTLGLSDRLTHLSGQLSGGQQQRVAIARALAAKPAVILADEPTGNLDKKSGEEVLRLLDESRRKFGQTVIMVTHDAEIAQQADRIVTIEDGLVASDTGVAV